MGLRTKLQKVRIQTLYCQHYKLSFCIIGSVEHSVFLPFSLSSFKSFFLSVFLSLCYVYRPKVTRNKFPLSGQTQHYEWYNISPIFPPRSHIYCFIVVCLPDVSFNRRLIFAMGNYGSQSCPFRMENTAPRPHSGHPRTTPNLLLRSDLPRSRNTQHEISRNKIYKHTHTHTHTHTRVIQRDFWGVHLKAFIILMKLRSFGYWLNIDIRYGAP